MKIFKRDPAASLAKARAALLATEAKIAELQDGRTAKLAEGDDYAPIEALDREIEAQCRRLTIHRDRIAVLQAECGAAAGEQRERERAAAIKVVEKKLASRVDIATELEATIARVGKLYLDLLGSESIAPDWPFAPPSPAFGTVDADGIRRETGWAMWSAGRPIGGRTTLPGPTNAGLGVTGVHPVGIAALVEQRSRALLASLRVMSLGEADVARVLDEPAEQVPARGFAAMATA